MLLVNFPNASINQIGNSATEKFTCTQASRPGTRIFSFARIKTVFYIAMHLSDCCGLSSLFKCPHNQKPTKIAFREHWLCSQNRQSRLHCPMLVSFANQDAYYFRKTTHFPFLSMQSQPTNLRLCSYPFLCLLSCRFLCLTGCSGILSVIAAVYVDSNAASVSELAGRRLTVKELAPDWLAFPIAYSYAPRCHCLIHDH